MTIRVNHRKFHPDIDGFDEDYVITIDLESISQFKELVDRALNCWDNAPKDMKDLGDMLTHGRVTQPHEQKKFTRESNLQIVQKGKFAVGFELPICEYCGARGEGHYHTCPILNPDFLSEKKKESSSDS